MSLAEVPSEVEAAAFDVFLAHDWGKDGANHARVRRVNEELKAAGFVTWFDGAPPSFLELQPTREAAAQDGTVPC